MRNTRVLIGIALTTLASGCSASAVIEEVAEVVDESTEIVQDVSTTDDEATPVASLPEVEPCTPAPESTPRIHMVPAWEQGDVRTLELAVLDEFFDNQTWYAPVTVEVTGSEKGYLSFSWESEQTLTESGQFNDVVMNLAEEHVDSLPPLIFDYTLDPDRWWVSLDNVDDVRAGTLASIAHINELMGHDSLAWAREYFEEIDDTGIDLILARNAYLWHSLEGYEFSVGDPFTFDDFLSNTHGGEPFPATTTLEVTELIDDDGCVSVSMTFEVDSEQYLPILLDTLSATEPLSEKDINELTSYYQDFVETQTVTAQYDYGSNQFRRVSERHVVFEGGQELVRTITLTDVSHLIQPEG